MNMKDGWVAAALSNDILVAELLSRLTQSSSHPPPHQFLRLPYVWGHRQPRSKPRKESAAMTSTRRSPTTPLSWSPSDGDCSNSNSSRPPSDLSRSNKGAYGTNNISKKKRDLDVTLIQQRVRRMKLDLNLHATSSCRNINMEEAPSFPRHQPSFALPDLNMMPSEEEATT